MQGLQLKRVPHGYLQPQADLSLRPGCPSSVPPATSHKMPSSFTTTHTVEFCETDMAGIVHFSNFYRWMEQAEHSFLRSVGLTVSNHLDDGSIIGFPRVSASCRFLSPAKFEDRLTVKLRVQRIGVKSLTYDVLFSIDERPVAKGVLKTVCCRFRTGAPFESIEIPDSYRCHFEEYSED